MHMYDLQYNCLYHLLIFYKHLMLEPIKTSY